MEGHENQAAGRADGPGFADFLDGNRETDKKQAARGGLDTGERAHGTWARLARPRGPRPSRRFPERESDRWDQGFSAPSSPCSNNCTGWPGMIVEIACL